MTLELHIKAPTQDAFGHMLWSHPMIPGVGPGELEVTGLNGFIWVPYERDCWHCGEPTTWIDLDFETHLHPGRCSERKWDEYQWAEMNAQIKASMSDWVESVRDAWLEDDGPRQG